MNFLSKFNHSFTNRDCLHYALLKALHDFKEKWAHKADRQEICNFFLQNVQKEISKILEYHFRKQTEIHQRSLLKKAQKKQLKKSNRDKSTTLMIFLFCHYCWSLFWQNYWRSFMLWNSYSWSHLKLTAQIQLAVLPCDSFLINNRNMTCNSVEK